MLLLGCLCLFGCTKQSPLPQAPSGPQSATAPNPPREPVRVTRSEELPDWSLGESDSESLDSPYKMSQFEIRPPASFRFIKSLDEPKSHSTAYYWIGQIREDETYPQFIVTITGLSSHSNAPLANVFQEVLGAIQRRRQEWSATPVEFGTINGLAFARSSWSGVATDAAREGLAGRTMHGVLYVTVRDDQAVQIMCQDVGPDYGEWLKQGEAGALSFRVATTASISP